MRWCVVVSVGLLPVGLLPFGCSVDDGGYAVGETAAGEGGEAGVVLPPSGGSSGRGGSGGGGNAGRGGDGGSAGEAAQSGAAGDSQLEAGGAGGEPGVSATCGDGQRDPGEDCDDGDANNDDEEGACNTRCFINECDNGATQSCAEAGAEGNCADGEMTCEDGEWSECSVEPQDADDCVPGDDANCNGKANEDCGCVEGEETTCGDQYASKGECAKITLTCTDAGTWPTNGACAPKSAEICNSSTTSDEDCDGEDDEADECNDCPSTNPCKNGGTCVDGDGEYTCACTAGFTGPTCTLPVFTALDWPQGFDFCYLWGMSGNGQWVTAQCGGDYTPYRWSRSTGWIRVQGDYAFGSMNQDGTLAACNSMGDPVRWSSTSGATLLPKPAGSEYASATFISNDGNVIVGQGDDQSQLLKWTGTAAPVVLKAPTGANPLWSNGVAVNGDGSVIFAYEGNTIVRWTTSTTGSFVDADQSGFPKATTADGSVVVGWRNLGEGVMHPMVWSQSTGIKSLEHQGLGGQARGISGDGKMIVGELGGWDTGLDSAAAFWRGINADATRLFNYLEEKGHPVSGWSSTRLHAVSRDGTIIFGEGVPESRGSAEGFIVVLPP